MVLEEAFSPDMTSASPKIHSNILNQYEVNVKSDVMPACVATSFSHSDIYKRHVTREQHLSDSSSSSPEIEAYDRFATAASALAGERMASYQHHRHHNHHRRSPSTDSSSKSDESRNLEPMHPEMAPMTKLGLLAQMYNQHPSLVAARLGQMAAGEGPEPQQRDGVEENTNNNNLTRGSPTRNSSPVEQRPEKSHATKNAHPLKKRMLFEAARSTGDSTSPVKSLAGRQSTTSPAASISNLQLQQQQKQSGSETPQSLPDSSDILRQMYAAFGSRVDISDKYRSAILDREAERRPGVAQAAPLPGQRAPDRPGSLEGRGSAPSSPESAGHGSKVDSTRRRNSREWELPAARKQSEPIHPQQQQQQQVHSGFPNGSGASQSNKAQQSSRGDCNHSDRHLHEQSRQPQQPRVPAVSPPSVGRAAPVEVCGEQRTAFTAYRRNGVNNTSNIKQQESDVAPPHNPKAAAKSRRESGAKKNSRKRKGPDAVVQISGSSGNHDPESSAPSEDRTNRRRSLSGAKRARHASSDSDSMSNNPYLPLYAGQTPPSPFGLPYSSPFAFNPAFAMQGMSMPFAVPGMPQANHMAAAAAPNPLLFGANSFLSNPLLWREMLAHAGAANVASMLPGAGLGLPVFPQMSVEQLQAIQQLQTSSMFLGQGAFPAMSANPLLQAAAVAQQQQQQQQAREQHEARERWGDRRPSHESQQQSRERTPPMADTFNVPPALAAKTQLKTSPEVKRPIPVVRPALSLPANREEARLAPAAAAAKQPCAPRGGPKAAKTTPKSSRSEKRKAERRGGEERKNKPTESTPSKKSKHSEDHVVLKKVEKEPLKLIKTQLEMPMDLADLDSPMRGDGLSGSPRGAGYKNLTRERRLVANARERTRVHTISSAFDELRAQVPSYSCNQKLSKLAILRIACSYIRTLSVLAGRDESTTFPQGVDQCTRVLQAESRARSRRKSNKAQIEWEMVNYEKQKITEEEEEDSHFRPPPPDKSAPGSPASVNNRNHPASPSAEPRTATTSDDVIAGDVDVETVDDTGDVFDDVTERSLSEAKEMLKAAIKSAEREVMLESEATAQS